MESAGAGLASVRASMPPRDNRADPKAVEDIPLPKRAEGNEEYGAAVKAEKHRQEAINQMNRLASFYLVSREGMARQEPPTFSAMPDVGVPEPVPAEDPVSLGEGQGAPSAAMLSGGSQAASPDRHADSAPGGGNALSDGSASHGSSMPRFDGHSPINIPDRAVGTELDSVQTVPPPTTAPVPGPPPPPPGSVPHDVTPVASFASGRSTLMPGDLTARAPGPPTASKQVPSIQGRPGPGTQGRAYDSTGRGPTAPNGRPAPISATAQGRSISNPTGFGQQPWGRSITGGTPRPIGEPRAQPGTPHTTGARPAQGVVGGRPSPGPVPGPGGSRVAKGPVVGAESADGSRVTSGAGQRGLAGAGPQGNGVNVPTSLRNGNQQGGVVGTPQTRECMSGTRRGGFTAGGVGLVRNANGDQRRSAQDDEAGDTTVR